MSGRSREPKTTNRAVDGTCRLAWWSILVALGLVVTQLFSLGHLVLFAHTRCEHGAMVHAQRDGWQFDVRLPVDPTGVSSIVSGENNDVEHDHCDSFATPPAVASVMPGFTHISVLETPSRPGVDAREAESAVAILALAPKTSPTA